MKNSELFMVPLTILLHLFSIYVDEAHNGVKYFLSSKFNFTNHFQNIVLRYQRFMINIMTEVILRFHKE